MHVNQFLCLALSRFLALSLPASDSVGKAQPAPNNEVHASFLAHVKKALGAEKSAELFQAIHSYKKTDNYENLISTVVNLFTEKDEDFCLLVRKTFFFFSVKTCFK